MSRIALSVGPVVSTREEEEALFDRLPDLARSWSAALDISKLGRWFSWNGCAKEQLGEYWISKMLLELQEGMQDPDEHPVAFDDLLGASRAKTPQAELAALKAANGGLRLAYRLMATKLQSTRTDSVHRHSGLLVMVHQTGEARPTAQRQFGIGPCCHAGRVACRSPVIRDDSGCFAGSSESVVHGHSLGRIVLVGPAARADAGRG